MKVVFMMKKNIYDFKKTAIALGISLVFLLGICGCAHFSKEVVEDNRMEHQRKELTESEAFVEYTEYPDFSGYPVIEINDNTPQFTDFEPFTEATDSFEYYSELDVYGRCGACYACLGTDLMPTEKRGKIGHIRPSGWHTVKYDIIEDRYLFNRCHLIGFQLTGENDNVKNLITGTRYFNTEGMLPYENKVANYIRETNNHVFYRVTPVFDGDNPVAKGVQMEALSVEDHGTGICFNVFIYNIQPGVRVDYTTGESFLDETVQVINEHAGDASDYDYILNINSEKFHYGNCQGVSDMKEHNKEYFKGTREDAMELGYEPCGSCKP